MKQIIGFTGRVLSFILLLIVLFSYAMFQGGFVSWFLFYSFLPFGLYSIGLIFYPLNSLQVERILSENQYRSGESLTATIQVKSSIVFPVMFLLVEDQLPNSLQHYRQKRNTKAILSTLFKREFSYQYILENIPRGEHEFSTIRVKMTDLFGIVEKEAFFEVKHNILVYPRYVEMSYRRLNQRFEQGVAASKIQLHRDTTMVVGTREYKPGDRFSWINWKISARKNELMTKEFEERQSEDMVLFLDRTYTPLFEEMITFAASLVRAILKKGIQVGLVSIGRDRVIFPMRAGESQLEQLYYHLAKVQCDSDYSFARVITEEAVRWPPTVSFCYITSRIDQQLVFALGGLASRNISGVIFMIKERKFSISEEELGIIKQMEQRGIIVKVIHEQNFSNALNEGGKLR